MSRRPPVIWMVWDAAADWLTRELIAEGALPNLARVAAKGVRAGARPPSPNCQTPPSLATLWTGVWPRRHGIHGYAVPGADGVSTRSGFDLALLQAEPIWRYAGKGGRTTVSVHIPWVMPLQSPDLPPGCQFAVEGYSRRAARGGTWRLDEVLAAGGLDVGPMHLSVQQQGDRVTIAAPGVEGPLWLSPDEGHDPAGHPLMLGPDSGLTVRLWRRPYDGTQWFVHSGIYQVRTGPVADLARFQAGAGPMVGEGLGSQYRRGLFGPRLAAGGDGSAERMLVRTIRDAAEYFCRAGVVAVRQHADADLYLLYQPCIDDVEHELIGWCDPRSRCFVPDVAGAARAAIREVYQMADRHLGAILQEVGDNCTVVVSSDHGMAGVVANVHPNEALRRAGLLAFDVHGRVDLATTAVFYHPADNGALRFNDRRPEVAEAAIRVLRSLRDPLTGTPVIHAIYPLDGESGWIPAMGDLFLALSDGYEGRADPSAELVVPSPKTASHGTYPERPSLQGIFYACGPGIRTGVDLGVIDNRDVFPLVCGQLGLHVPNNIEGGVPESALESR